MQGRTDTSCLYVGTYTTRSAEGIYSFVFDRSSGALEPIGLAAELSNPTFLCLDPKGAHLYAVSEVRESNTRRDGAIYAFSVNRTTGGLTPINSQPSGGVGPCHLSVDHTGRILMVANYASGSVAVLPIRPDGGVGKASAIVQHHGAGLDRERQSGPHAHGVVSSPDNRFALVADLGLDRVLIYRIEPSTGRLWANNPAGVMVRPGAGPRHLTFHPSRPLVYVVTELDNTVIAFEWDAAQGALHELQTVSSLPRSFDGVSYGAEIACDPTGCFLYVTNRGHDSVAIFRVDESTGTVSLITHLPCGGKHPRHLAIHPHNRWLLVANQDSDSIVVFHRDPETGQLTPTSRSAVVSLPVCVLYGAD